jgi:hypothetical protein
MMAQINKLITLNIIIDELIAHNLLSPEAKNQIAEQLTEELIPRPWFISALMTVAAWFSVIPFLAFLFFIGLIDTSTDAMNIGLILVVGTVVLHYWQNHIFFLEQLTLALNLTGQMLFIIGLAGETEILFSSLATIILQILLFASYRESIIRFLATLLIIAALLVLLETFNAYQAIHLLILLTTLGAAGCWYRESYLLSHRVMAPLYQPLGYGLVVALFIMLLSSILPDATAIVHINWWISTLGLTLILLAVESYILRYYQISLLSPHSMIILVGTFLISLLLPSPGLIAALIVLFLGFQRGNRVLIGIAIVFLIVFLIAYYYHLEVTLLIKSLILMSSGIALLILRWIFKRLPAHEEAVQEETIQNESC